MATPDESPTPRPEAGPVGWSEIQLVKRHPTILSRGRTALVLIDLQERLLPVMHELTALRTGVRRLLKAAAILDVPVLVTEQYRKGLGATDPELRSDLGRATFLEKMTFSAVGEPAFVFALERLRPTHVLVCGIETHVCVAQTALDLLVRGYAVSVAADAVSSRRPADRDVALARLRGAGVTVSTSEAMILELTEQAGTAEFKRILEVIR